MSDWTKEWTPLDRLAMVALAGVVVLLCYLISWVI
jgi:hypothetical protein